MFDIKVTHTPCKNCVFADYKDDVQIGCHLGYIEKYKKSNNVDVIEAYDEDKQFYIISKKKCFGYKEPKYFKNNNMENASIEEKVKYINDMMHIKYLVIIDCVNRTPEQLNDVLTQIKKANVLPHFIMVMTYNTSPYSFSDYYVILNKSKIKSKWKIKGLVYKDQTLITTAHQSINIGSENCNFVLCVGDDSSKVDEIINKANSMVFDEYEKFSVISNKSKQTILFNSLVYKAALAHKLDIITNYEEYIIV